MQILIIILLKINSLIPQWLIWSGSGLGAAIAGFFVTKKRLKKKKKVTLEQVMGKLEGLESKVERIDNQVSDIDKRQRDEEFIHTLRYKIKDVVNSIIDSRSLSYKMENLLIDCAERAADLFVEVKRDGYNNVSSQYIKRIALQKVERLSNEYGVGNLDKEIREYIAYPTVDRLVSDLETFKRGIFNGKTDDKFQKIALSFVNDTTNNAIEVYNRKKEEVS